MLVAGVTNGVSSSMGKVGEAVSVGGMEVGVAVGGRVLVGKTTGVARGGLVGGANNSRARGWVGTAVQVAGTASATVGMRVGKASKIEVGVDGSAATIVPSSTSLP